MFTTLAMLLQLKAPTNKKDVAKKDAPAPVTRD